MNLRPTAKACAMMSPRLASQVSFALAILIQWGGERMSNNLIPGILKQKTGFSVLNAGMSSYGTARESMLLSQLDTSQVKYIVWQYCANDAEENHAYIPNHRLSPHTPQNLDSVMQLHAWTRRYFPGRHFFTLAKLSLSNWIESMSSPRRETPASPAVDSTYYQQARDFLSIVNRSAIDAAKTKIIVLELGPYPSIKVDLFIISKTLCGRCRSNNRFSFSIAPLSFPKKITTPWTSISTPKAIEKWRRHWLK